MSIKNKVVIQAYLEGKAIQYKCIAGAWINWPVVDRNLSGLSPMGEGQELNWRVKPATKKQLFNDWMNEVNIVDSTRLCPLSYFNAGWNELATYLVEGGLIEPEDLPDDC